VAEPGALVLHGLTATTQSVQGLADALAAAGFRTAVPLLPGHGTTVEDLETTRWEDWVAAADGAYRELAAVCQRVVVVGLSMGGSLAGRVVADHAGERSTAAAGLVVVNPFVDPPAESFRAALRQMLDEGIRRAPGIGGDVADPSAPREVGYDALPIATLLSLCEGLADLLTRLARITCPVLIMTSRTDHVVPTVSSDVLADRVAGPVERVWLERSFHVATLDHDRAEVERRTVEFARAATATPTYHPPMPGRLSRDDVLHVARLARLSLSDDEVDVYTEQLAAVLEHAADVAALDTSGVPPTAHPLPLENVLRDDVVTPGLDRDEVLAQAPSAESGRFKVPPILGLEP
jgi:carboxylesterase